MFKNITIYQLENQFDLDENSLNELLKNKPLKPCLSQEIESLGWVESFDKSSTFVSKINNTLLFRLGIEEKILSKSMINKSVNDYIKKNNIEIENKAMLKELKEKVFNDLLPQALAEQSYITGYIDIDKNLLIVDASSFKKASLLTSYLRKTIGSLPIKPLSREYSTFQALMTNWVLNGIRSNNFELLENISMTELTDQGGKVVSSGLPIGSDEIITPLSNGWQVTSLRLDYDDQMSFKLDNHGILKSIKYNDQFFDQLAKDDDSNINTETEYFCMIGTFRNLIDEFKEIIK